MRNCEFKDYDIDVALSLKWWRANNDLLEIAMRNAGFKPEYSFGAFGTINKLGYKMAWNKRGVKVDLFSRIDEPHHYVWSLWKSGKYCNCTASREEYSAALWGDILVHIPQPFEITLVSFYRKDWKLPFPRKWRWFEDAFEIGSCVL